MPQIFPGGAGQSGIGKATFMMAVGKHLLWAIAATWLLPGPLAMASENTELQLKLVDQRIARLQQQGETAESSATLGAYQETQNLLRETQRFDQAAAQFQEEMNSASQLEADIRARIDAAGTNPEVTDPATLEKLGWRSLNDKANDLRNALQGMLSQRDLLDQQIAAEANSAETIRARLSAIDGEQRSLPDSLARFELEGAPSQFEASQWQVAAHRAALDAERRSLNAQLTSQPTRSRIRRAQREELVQNIELQQRNLAQLELALAGRRHSQSDQALQQATPGTVTHDLLQYLADGNTALGEHRAQMATDLNKADAEKTRTDGRLFELMEQFNSARRLVDSGGKASMYGPLLMTYFMGLDHYRPPASKLRSSNRIGGLVVDRAHHEQELAELLDYGQFINGQLQALGASGAATPELLDAARPLAQERNNLLTDLMAAESELVQLLGNIDISYEQLDSLVGEFQSFLIGHILWVRSHLPLDRNIFNQVLLDIAEVKTVLLDSKRLSGRTAGYIALLAGLLLLVLRRRMWRRIESNNQLIGRPRDDSILFTVGNLLLTLLRSAAVPLVMVGVALSIESSKQGVLPPLALALLFTSAGVMFISFLRDATAPSGICPVHFGWPEARCKAASRLMTWLLLRLLPAVIVTSFLINLEENSPQAVLGRLMLCAVALLVALRVHLILNRQREKQAFRNFPPWVQNTLLVTLTGSLMVLVLSGFLLPARIIYYCLILTMLSWVGLLFLRELLMRWLLVARRRIRFHQLMESQADSAAEEKAEIEARQASLGDITDSTAQLLNSLVYGLGVVVMVMIWSPLLPAVQGLQRFSLWTVNQTVNGEQLQTHITLATIVLAILIFAITFYAARRIPALIDLIMRSGGKSTPATRYTVSTITNYIIIAVGTMVFFSTLKVSWSQLQWLVAALGVGIGFGLQEIVANFISGLIILFERPIRVGDVVTIGQSEGTVTRIQIRATTIRDWDGKELLVPNKEFVTGRLLNWTLTDTNNRVVLDVGIAYGSDVEAALQLLEKVVSSHPSVLKDPPPNILFTKFGDSALMLSARCFLGDLDDRNKHMSELHQQVYAAFNKAGIVISFPQLDVHLDPSSPLTVRLEGTAPAS
jgi:potassium efflux system protein